MGQLQHETTHVDDGLARFAGQFKGKQKLQNFITAFLQQIQDLEDAAWGVYVGRWLVNAVGVQLDTIGRIVGQPRGNSVNDAEYRTRITARILCNASSGDTPSIYKVFQTLLPSVSLQLLPDYPAGFEFFINTVITLPYAFLYVGFLGAAKAAGVMANLIFYLFNDPASFFTETTWTTSTSPVSPGATSIPVTSTTGWPSSGAILIDAGATSELVNFSAITPTSITCSALANSHVTDTAVQLVGTQGQGFAVSGGYIQAAAKGVSSFTLTSVGFGVASSSTPAFPFSISVDEGTPNYEVVSVTNIFGGVVSLAAPSQFAHDGNTAIIVLAPVITGTLPNLEYTGPGGALAGALATIP